MGESSMDAPISDDQMGDSEATDLTALQVSVSFGRFENDLLDWEKWSTFPSNKYLEEVEKCSTPGSVAQKKAYFEAHYKNIAARKAELEDQDKTQTRDPVDSQVLAQRDLGFKFCESEQALDAERLNDQHAVTGTVLENEVADSASDRVDSEIQAQSYLVDKFAKAEQLLDAEKLNIQFAVNGVELENEMPNSETEMGSDHVNVDEPKDSRVRASESKDSMPLIDKVKDESYCRLVSPELHESEEATLVALSPGSESPEELPQHADNAIDIVSIDKEEKVKSEKLLKSRKATATKKATNTTVPKKKPAASSTPMSSLLSTPKFSRPTLSKSTMSESRASSKKEHGNSPSINRKPARAESRRAAPTSLHMSLSFDPDRPAKTEPPPTTGMRKSLFMEKMGDKDIVKRAFKAFRNDFNHLSSSSPGKPTLTSQIPEKETGIKASVVGTPRKKIDGVSNLVKRSPQSSHTGMRKTLNSTRSPHTSLVANEKNVKSVSSNYGLRSHDMPDKRKEKLEGKANGKATERTQIQSKVKKGAEIKRLSPDHYTKSKPILGTAKLKSSLDKKSAI